MANVIVRAPDTATAMEEVVRRLGPDAYIVATRKRDGMVEIEATTEVEAAPEPNPLRTRTAIHDAVPDRVTQDPPASDVQGEARFFRTTFLEALGGGPAAEMPKPANVRTDPTLAGPDDATAMPTVAKARDAAQAALETLASIVKGGLLAELAQPGYPEALADTLRSVICERAASGEDTIAALLPAAEFQPADWDDIALVGPAGAGRSLTAVKLAAALVASGSARLPSVVAPDESAFEDRLWRLCAALGVGLYSPRLDEIGTITGGLRILDMPATDTGIGAVAAALAVLKSERRTAVLLVLPTGLSPERVMRECALWKDYATGVLLTRTDTGAPSPGELAALAGAGLPVLMATGTRSPVDALTPVTQDMLADWLGMNAVAPEPATQDDRTAVGVPEAGEDPATTPDDEPAPPTIPETDFPMSEAK